MTSRACIALTVALLSCPALAAAAGSGLPQSVPIPNGVADSRGTVVYVNNPKDRAEAIEVASGRVLWQSAATCRPLLLFGDRLIGWAPVPARPNMFLIVVLDARKGDLLVQTPALVLDHWAHVELVCGHWFTLAAEPAGEEVLLRWEAGGWPLTGCVRPPDAKYRPMHAEGLARVNPDKGVIRSVTDEPAPPKLPAGLASLTAGFHPQGEGWAERPPLRFGRHVVTLHADRSSGPARYDHRVWSAETGELVRIRPLDQGDTVPRVSPGGRHFFVPVTMPKEGSPEGKLVFVVFEAATARRVASVARRVDDRDLACIGSRVFIINQKCQGLPRPPLRSLRAIDSATGRVLWERPVWAPPPVIVPP